MTTELLFKAILAMDAYNRGYDAGIEMSGDQLGSISVLKTTVSGQQVDFDSSLITDQNGNPLDVPIGFYAIAYTYGDETIISFRGTDNTVPTIENPIPDDIYHGWPLGGGNTNSEQGRMAIEFYQAVAGSGNWLSANISLTGHSLGGGLAGYVGAI